MSWQMEGLGQHSCEWKKLIMKLPYYYTLLYVINHTRWSVMKNIVKFYFAVFDILLIAIFYCYKVMAVHWNAGQQQNKLGASNTSPHILQTFLF